MSKDPKAFRNERKGQERSDAREELGRKVTAMRLAAKYLTKHDLCMDAKVSITTLSHIEKGVATGNTITVTTMFKIAAVCNHKFHIVTPRDDWNDTTTLGALFNMGAKMDFIPL
jgi:transcriptional regulator with XRE-family HTH domain